MTLVRRNQRSVILTRVFPVDVATTSLQGHMATKIDVPGKHMVDGAEAQTGRDET